MSPVVGFPGQVRAFCFVSETIAWSHIDNTGLWGITQNSNLIYFFLDSNSSNSDQPSPSVSPFKPLKIKAPRKTHFLSCSACAHRDPPWSHRAGAWGVIAVAGPRVGGHGEPSGPPGRPGPPLMAHQRGLPDGRRDLVTVNIFPLEPAHHHC